MERNSYVAIQKKKKKGKKHFLIQINYKIFMCEFLSSYIWHSHPTPKEFILKLMLKIPNVTEKSILF